MDDNDVQYYFKAADIVFIPRLNTINSAIIPVASFFKRVFVGADIGNIPGGKIALLFNDAKKIVMVGNPRLLRKETIGKPGIGFLELPDNMLKIFPVIKVIKYIKRSILTSSHIQ